jgi:hypothetical protein
MEGRTFLHSLRDPTDLLEARLKLAPNVRLEQTFEPAQGSWSPLSGRLLRVGGLEYVGKIDGPGAAMLAGFDGRRTLKEHLQELAAAINSDLSELTPPGLQIIRRLVEQGFLVPGEA